MSKRTNHTLLPETGPRSVKMARIDHGTAWTPTSPPFSHKQLAATANTPEEDEEDQYRSKNAIVDHNPTISSSYDGEALPWLGIEEYCRYADPLDTESVRRDQQAQEAYDRIKAQFQCAQEEYAQFRNNRLPSPAPSDDGPVVDDSDADEYGYTPLMLNLDNDDPEVRRIFGAAYASRLRDRMAKRRNPTPSMKPRYFTIASAKAAAARLLRDEKDDNGTTRPSWMQAGFHKQLLTKESTKSIRPKSRRRRGPTNTVGAPVAKKQNVPLLSPRRLRHTQQYQHYELDHRGKARPVI
ncbi:hypothetical protein CIB48_g3128 [Xylaria polymorpha]|nr:hypothetical protein CIB48_g3128 [Xylaria polymorpha]